MSVTRLAASRSRAKALRLLIGSVPNGRKRAAVATAALALAMIASSCAEEHETPAEPPHILLLSIDTLRPDYLGMYGYDRETSPYLDSLLADAFHFPKAVATVPRTTPSLASMLTGAYPHNTGVRVLTDALRDDVAPITEVLHDAGYRTLAVVTSQILGAERRLSRGFDVYLQAEDERDAAATTDAALELLEQNDFSKPLFLWAHYIDPHTPYVSDPAIIEAFDPEYEGRYEKNFGQIPPELEGEPDPMAHTGPYPLDLPKRLAVHRNPLPEEVVAHVRRLYAADIRNTDDQIKRLVERLEEWTRGNLLIVFTSDHGESLGEHAFYWDHGDYVYNASSRIPLAILPPNGHPARRAGSFDDWVSGVDLAPTLLELLGREIPPSMAEQMEGRSLVPAMRGESMPPVPVFVESGHAHFFKLIRGRADNTTAGKFRAVYSGDWKLIWAPGNSDPKLTWQLYDLEADPHETRNLYAADHPQFLQLRDLIVSWADKGRSTKSSGAISDEDMELLKKLGYVDPGDAEAEP